MNNQSISIDKRCASNLILDNDFTINYMIPLYGRLYYKNPKHSSSFLNDILRVFNQTSNPRQKEVHNKVLSKLGLLLQRRTRIINQVFVGEFQKNKGCNHFEHDR